MSDSTNPLFDSEKEFLERQKEEYKNALMGSVDEIKDRSTRIGKTVLIAGGVLAGAYFLTKMIRSNRGSHENPYYLSEKKAQRLRRGQRRPDDYGSYDYADYAGSYEDDGPARQEGSTSTSLAKNFAQSDLFKMISHQVSALLLLLLTRKVESYFGVNVFKQEKEQDAHTDVVIIEDVTTEDAGFTNSDKDARQPLSV